MAFSDGLFGIQETALRVQQRRLELIAGNIANADTPGFAARDVDFRSVLAKAQQAATTPDVQTSATMSALDATPAYRIPLQPAMDGNTVDLQVEQGQYADAALRYQASLGFIDGKLKSLITAITGQ